MVVQAKFREIAKTITTPGFLVFLAISRTPKKMSEPGVIIIPKAQAGVEARQILNKATTETEYRLKLVHSLL